MVHGRNLSNMAKEKVQKNKAIVIVPTPPQENKAIGLIETAIKEKVPIDTLERLFALELRFKQENARDSFLTALARFQGECPTIKKTKKVMNKDRVTVRYVYAPLDSIVDQVRTLLAKNGLAYTTNATFDGDKVTAICTITHNQGHSEASSFQVPIDPEAYMSMPQKFAAALTFAKRYAFCNALGILSGDEDTDAADVGKPKSPALDEYKKSLEAAKTIVELRAAFLKLPGPVGKELTSFKDELKDKLTPRK